jgi:fucose permease
MVNGAGNTLVADLHDEPRAKAAALNRLGVFFGFGALLLPFAMGLLLEALGLAGILFAAAALCLAPAAISGLLAFPSPKPGGRVSVGATARLLRDPVVLLFAATLFFESANESVAGGYISTLLARDLGLDVRAVSWVVAGYWAALILARLALSRLALRVSASRLLVGSALCAAGALTVLVLTHHRAVAVAATTATAAALAGIFPTALGVVGARFASYTGTVFGILFTAALAGGVTLPWLTGQVAAAHGLRSALWLAVGSFLVVAALQSAAARWVRRPARGGPA